MHPHDPDQVDPPGGDEAPGGTDPITPPPRPDSPEPSETPETPGLPEAPESAGPVGDSPEPEPASAAGTAPDATPPAAAPPERQEPPQGPSASGTIQSLDAEDAILLLEDGRTARMHKIELADAQGKIHAVVGDPVSGTLEETEGGLWLHKRSARAEALEKLADAMSQRTPVTGRIAHAIKGGYEVRLLGVRAFCPSSQLTLRRDDLRGDPVGQEVPFLVTKWDAEGRSIVVSRRKLLEKEQKRLAASARERIAPGARLTGRVVGFQAYGAFVDLGGLQGLLHVSEMSHARVGDPKGFLKSGQEIDVLVLKHDEGFKKISLSMKALEADPFETLGASLQVGQVVKVTSRRVTSVGAFVELAPGLEGLIPARVPSEAATDIPAAGTELLARIVDLDARRRRITLLPAPEGASEGDVLEAPAIEAGARVEGFVDHCVPFGAFIKLGARKTGLLHASESLIPFGEDLSKAFPPGSRVTVEILEISEDGQKIRLTRRTAAERSAAAAARHARHDGGGGDQDRGPGGGPRRGAGGGPGGGHGRGPGGGAGPGAGPRGGGPRPGGGHRDGPRPPRGDRKPRREGGGEPVHNPAAAPRSGFAVFGDAFKARLEAREAAAREAEELAAAQAEFDDADGPEDDTPDHAPDPAAGADTDHDQRDAAAPGAAPDATGDSPDDAPPA